VKEAASADFRIADLLSQPVPRLKVTPVAPDFVARGGSSSIEVTVGETPGPVKAIRIWVNGRLVGEEIPETGGIAPGAKRYAVPLAKGENTVTVTAINDVGETPGKVHITHEGNGLLDNRGTLYILAIGVDKYPGLNTDKINNDLRFAGADARAFANAIEK